MRLPILLAIMLTVLGLVRIISTYHVFNQTTDEPAHIAAGMEWLQRGAYTFEPLHPPLARVATAIGPYLSGIRLSDEVQPLAGESAVRRMYRQGNEVLAAHGRYLHNLALARLGILPFFILASFVVWYWAYWQYGSRAAVLALLLFTTCPPILAHAGLATTDMGLTACFSGALLALVQWLRRPTYVSSATLGLATGCAILTKLSALPFLSACALLLVTAKYFLREDQAKPHHPSWYRASAVAALVVFVVLWAGYRFSIGPLTEGHRSHIMTDRFVPRNGVLHNAAYSVVESRLLPMPAFWLGLGQVYEYNHFGHKSYLLGKVSQDGWWYFFPVAIAVKTPIAFLLLIGFGAGYIGRLSWRTRNWVLAAPVLASAALMAVAMHSRLTMGLRHILPIYPLFAIIGGVAADRLMKLVRPKYIGVATAIVLLTWQLLSSFLSHPDYLAYFNAFVGQHPENVLIGSDLDWGQDMLRLAKVLHENQVHNFAIVYAGTSDLHNFDLPPYRTLNPYEPATGWIAISILPLKTGDLYQPNDSFHWLEAYRPFCTVGRSMRLYHLTN